MTGLIFGYTGATHGTFRRHVQDWIEETREIDPDLDLHLVDRVYNLSRKFVMYRDENKRFLYRANKAKDPVARFFFTQVLTSLNLTNLRPFMRADKLGIELFTI